MVSGHWPLLIPHKIKRGKKCKMITEIFFIFEFITCSLGPSNCEHKTASAYLNYFLAFVCVIVKFLCHSRIWECFRVARWNPSLMFLGWRCRPWQANHISWSRYLHKRKPSPGTTGLQCTASVEWQWWWQNPSHPCGYFNRWMLNSSPFKTVLFFRTLFYTWYVTICSINCRS